MAGRRRAAARGLALVLLLGTTALLRAQSGAVPTSSPPAPASSDPAHADAERQLVETTCSACHDISQVTSQHLSADDWAATVDKMIGLGAQISDGDRGRIIAYLAAHQGPQSARNDMHGPAQQRARLASAAINPGIDE